MERGGRSRTVAEKASPVSIASETPKNGCCVSTVRAEKALISLDFNGLSVDFSWFSGFFQVLVPDRNLPSPEQSAVETKESLLAAAPLPRRCQRQSPGLPLDGFAFDGFACRLTLTDS